jgi:hypothetical protein
MDIKTVEKELKEIRNLAARILNTARFRKNPHPITITPSWVVNRYLKVKGRCEYTNIPMQYKKKRGKKNKLISNPFRLSIDRIDSYKGYHPDNCCLAIWEANRFKGVRFARNFKRDFLKTYQPIIKSLLSK